MPEQATTPPIREKLPCRYTPAFQKFRIPFLKKVRKAMTDPDSGITLEELQKDFETAMRDLGAIERIQNLYRIYDKTKGQFVQIDLKPGQRRFLEEAKGRDLILKSRQIGFTTLSGIIAYDLAIWEDGRCGIMAHDRTTSETIFEIVKNAHKYFVQEFDEFYPLVEKKSNVRELSWENRKGFVAVRLSFQGYTLSFLHISEAAFADEDRIIFSLQAVPENGRIVLESTPNGPGGFFYNIYQDWKRRKGSAPFKGHFFPWFENYPEHPERWTSDGKDLQLDTAERELVDLYGLKDYHILYRRFKLAELGGSPEKFEIQYPADDVTCFLSGEDNVYSTTTLKTQQHYLCEPSFVGNLLLDGKLVRWSTDTKKGLVSLWDLPKPGKVYFIGADPSSGLGGENRDPGCAIVIDGYTGEQVAELHGHMDPDLFADELFKLGHYFNQAFICVESNNHGHAVILKLKGSYPNLYRRQQFDNMTKRLSPVIGFQTTNAEKMAITDTHQAACREGVFKVRSKELHNEMGTFVQTSSENGRSMKRNARPGCHDDRVMAACLAWEMKRSRPLDDFANERMDPMLMRGMVLDGETGFWCPGEDVSYEW